MSKRVTGRRGGFTLVEMLVVIGIIAVLVALLTPAAMIAVRTARDARMVIEIGELEKAIETYKLKKGDYPPSLGEIDIFDRDGDNNRTESMYQPNLRYLSVAERHLKKAYPKMRPEAKEYFYNYIAPQLDQDEALVFWLSLTINDERDPFPTVADFSTGNPIPKPYYPAGYQDSANKNVVFGFREEKLLHSDLDGIPSYKADYAKDTTFVYLDARTYIMHVQRDYAAIAGNTRVTQAYCEDSPLALNATNGKPYIKPTAFQIICAGQDGEFGAPADQFDLNNNGAALYPKRFIGGNNYTDEDKDNLTNFGSGKRLGASIPGA